MKYGIYNLLKIKDEEVIVRCNNCFHYYYDDITDERNANSLKILYDKEDTFFYKGCPVCKTEEYLTDINLVLVSNDQLELMQKDNSANFDAEL